jgi:hypothetical protein
LLDDGAFFGGESAAGGHFAAFDAGEEFGGEDGGSGGAGLEREVAEARRVVMAGQAATGEDSGSVGVGEAGQTQGED